MSEKERLCCAEIEHIVHLGGLAGETADVVVGDPDQALRVVERERAEQQSVDHAENGGAGADAEADDENGEGSESGIAAQGAEGIAQVLQDAVGGGQGHGVS